MRSAHILVVEDESKIAQLLSDYLQQDGFDATGQGRADNLQGGTPVLQSANHDAHGQG